MGRGSTLNCHFPICNRQCVGRRVKCQTTHKTGMSFVRINSSSFPLLTVYVANWTFFFCVWHNYFHSNHHEISAALLSYPATQLPRMVQPCVWSQNGSGYPKVLSLVFGADFERVASTLGKLDKRTEVPQHIIRIGISFCLPCDSDKALSVPYEETCRVGLGYKFSDQTVRNRRPFVGLILTPCHRAAQMVFAREHQYWQVRQWRPVHFTDECQFNLNGIRWMQKGLKKHRGTLSGT